MNSEEAIIYLSYWHGLDEFSRKKCIRSTRHICDFVTYINIVTSTAYKRDVLSIEYLIQLFFIGILLSFSTIKSVKEPTKLTSYIKNPKHKIVFMINRGVMIRITIIFMLHV